MVEVKARLAVKPSNAQVEGSRVAKAEMETSLADMPENARAESSKTEMETRLADTPANVQVESIRDDKVEIETGGDGAEIMLSKELDEMRVSVENMPACQRGRQRQS